MPEIVIHGLELLIHLLEICGASLLILGFVVATWKWVQRLRREGHSTALGYYRQAIGRSVLIGLEVLVAATIIKTVIVEPSLEGLGLLAGMIILRTTLGWTTALEMFSPTESIGKPFSRATPPRTWANRTPGASVPRTEAPNIPSEVFLNLHRICCRISRHIPLFL